MLFDKIFSSVGRHKIVFVIILSYALVISLFLAGFFTIYFVSQNMFRSYFDYNARIIADSISEKYDENVGKRNIMAVNTILLSKEIQTNVAELQKGSDAVEHRWDIEKQLEITLLNNEYLSDILLYIKSRRLIICSTGFCTPEQYYTAYANENFSSYDEFVAFLNEGKVPETLYSRDTMQTYARTVYNLCYGNEVLGKIILKNDFARFFKSFTDENSDVVIMEDGYVIAASDEELAAKISEKKDANGDSFELKEKLVYGSSAGDGRRKSFYIMNREQMKSAQNVYSIIVIAVCVICLLLCAAVCVFFMLFHYIPVKRFADFINHRSNGRQNNYSYQMFSEAEYYIEKSEKNSQKELETKEEKLREIYLEQWLLYRKEQKEGSISLLPGQMCGLAILKVTEYEQIFFEQKDEEDTLKLEMANFILINVFDEKFREVFSNVVKCRLNDLLIWLFIFEEGTAWEDGISDIVCAIKPFLKNEFNISFDCYRGERQRDMNKLIEDFDVLMLEIKQKDQCFTQDTLTLLTREEKATSYYFPETVKKQFYDSVEEGNTKSALQIVDHIFRHNEESGSDGINNLKALAAEVYNTIIIRLGGFDVDVEKLFEENRLGRDIIMCERKEELYGQMKNFIELICGFFLSKQKQNESVYTRARRYIYQNFRSPQLSSTAIAEEIGLSRDYFLSIFKKESGMKATDYINKVRIEEACKILKKTNCSVSETAKLVGYSNTKTFTRVFDKIMGITPGAYRENEN